MLFSIVGELFNCLHELLQNHMFISLAPEFVVFSIVFRRLQRNSLYAIFQNLKFLNFVACPDCYYVSLKCSDVDLTEKLDYSSAVAVLGFSLILAILRSFNVRHEATRVMVAAPLLAFALTHILYINFYELDYGNYYSFLPPHTDRPPRYEQL